MECPNCGKTDSKVIDSRLSKDRIAIRRRRQCLICSSRYTTYEATSEQLLPHILKVKVERGSPLTNLKEMLSFMPIALKALSKETELLLDKMEKHEKKHANKESKKKIRERKFAKRKAESLKRVEVISNIIKRHKRGVDISTLKAKTDFDAKKIHSIVFKLKQQGKLKSDGKGFYLWQK